MVTSTSPIAAPPFLTYHRHPHSTLVPDDLCHVLDLAPTADLPQMGNSTSMTFSGSTSESDLGFQP